MSGKDVYTTSLFLVSLIGSVLVLLLVLSMIVLYYSTAQRLDYERTVRPPFAETEAALADQQARLVEYERLPDVEEHGKIRHAFRIPIERAMEKVLADWKSGALPGVVVEAPPAGASAPVAPPAAAPGTTPAGPSKAPARQAKGAADKETKNDGKNDGKQ